MANFCGKCGRPLQDGEVCNCSNETQTAVQQDVTMGNQANVNVQFMNTQGAPNGQPMYNQAAPNVQPNYSQGMPNGQQNYSQQNYSQPNGQPNYSQPNGQPSQFSQQMAGAANVAGDYAKNIWKTLVDIWKTPGESLKNFVDEKNLNHSLGFIGAQIILTILFSCFIVKKIYTSIMGLFGGFSSLFEYGGVKIPYFRIILSSIIVCGICACLFALITMVVTKNYAKIEMSFKKGICLYATYCAAQLPFLAVGIVFALFSLPLAILCFAIGGILGYFYVHTALNNGQIQDQNKRVYTSFLVFAGYIIASLILFWIYTKLF